MDHQISAFFIPLLAFVPFFVILLFGSFRRLNCPNCGSPLPWMQSPLTKSRRQWIEGDYRCAECGCETDLDGNKVAPGTGPRPGWQARSVLLIVPPAVVGVVLLLISLRLIAQEPAPGLGRQPRVAPQPRVMAPAPVEPGR